MRAFFLFYLNLIFRKNFRILICVLCYIGILIKSINDEPELTYRTNLWSENQNKKLFQHSKNPEVKGPDLLVRIK